MSDILCFWLIPTRETRVWFTRQIEQLAERYGAPTFEPHLTAHAGPIERIASPASVLAESSFEFDPFSLNPTRIGHSSQFTKTLFVEFHQTQELLDLAAKLRDRIPSDYILVPHMSLLYHPLADAERTSLAQEIRPPSDPVHFEVIQAVKCPAVNQTADHVRSWQILEEWRL